MLNYKFLWYHSIPDNDFLSDTIYEVNSFCLYSKINERSKTEMYILGHKFQVHVDF